MEDKLQAILFRDKDEKLAFVRDTIEPHLEKGENEHPGFHQVVTGKQFKDIIGKLALDWLSIYPKSDKVIVTKLLKAALQHSPHSSLVNLIKRRVSELEESGDRPIITQLWFVAGVIADFDHFFPLLRKNYSSKQKNMLFVFDNLMSDENLTFDSKIPPEHLEFLIETFISDWPDNRGFLPVGSNDEESASTASWFIQRIIRSLGRTSGGLDILEKIKKKSGFAAYEHYARYVIGRAKRKLTEEQQPVSLEGVRDILLSGKPATIDGLQVIVMEALEDAQDEILTGQTDEYEVFWQGDTSHCENYCRDRLIDKLEPLLGCSIRVHKEGAMSNERRCDILCTSNDFDLPIEIKGQWHPNLWTAAQEQLEKNYSSGYRSQGHGIYLVLWFGYEIEANKNQNYYHYQKTILYMEINQNQQMRCLTCSRTTINARLRMRIKSKFRIRYAFLFLMCQRNSKINPNSASHHSNPRPVSSFCYQTITTEYRRPLLSTRACFRVSWGRWTLPDRSIMGNQL